MKSIASHSIKLLLPTAVALSLLVVAGARAFGADSPAATALPADAEQAWQVVTNASATLDSPDAVGAAADKAREFMRRFPRSEHAAEARKLQIRMLMYAATPGNTARQSELTSALAIAVADRSLPENDRVDYRILQLRSQMTKAARTGMGQGQAGRANPADPRKIYTDGLIGLTLEFPKNEKLYATIVNLAQSEEGETRQKLAKTVVASASAPAKLKKKAQDILDGKIFKAADSIGKPVEIKFSAVDGRAVDLSKLKGKVVLVDFWATWCGPCVAEIPHVKEAYEKYHDKGFEIIGISFDREGDKQKLINFTKDKGMPWPQYFDGKFWDNEYGEQFNIRAIPEMWLIDKQGNLAISNAREDLAGKVARLLEQN